MVPAPLTHLQNGEIPVLGVPICHKYDDLRGLRAHPALRREHIVRCEAQGFLEVR